MLSPQFMHCAAQNASSYTICMTPTSAPNTLFYTFEAKLLPWSVPKAGSEVTMKFKTAQDTLRSRFNYHVTEMATR